jgi:enoyl-CoA hydratase
MTLLVQRSGAGLVVLRSAGRCFSAGHDLADLETGELLPSPDFQADVIESPANLAQTGES